MGPKKASKTDASQELSCWSADERSRIVESFQWNKEMYLDYYFKYDLRNSILSICCIPLAPFTYENAKDRANSYYLAVTKDEILFCQKRIKTMCRCFCFDQGECRKTIPLDRVQDVVLKAPAGDCCPTQALHLVEIQTAGSASGGPGMTSAELTLHGLNDASRFVDTVRRLKREKGHTEFDGAGGKGVGTTAPAQLEMTAAILSTLKNIEDKTAESITFLTQLQGKL